MIAVYGIIGAVIGAAVVLLISNRKRLKSGPGSTTSPEKVKAFYNEQNENFLKVYGEIIQAYRTTDVSKLLDYELDSMGLEDGMRVVDAGCGICGPAAYFASKRNIKIDAVTISEEQVKKGEEHLSTKKQNERVKIHLGDYHQLPLFLSKESYDLIYFLESFGHSHDHSAALQSAWDILKPGGTVYIKDLFKKIGVLEGHQERIDREINTINEAYRYNIADLYEVLHAARRMGFVVSFLKTIDLKVDEFENLTISNEFQELTGIAQIENWDDYIFPVDFFELKLYKPVFDLMHGTDKYFLQNLYYMQVHKKRQEEL
jgi:ubiquinone/menaquinone biosynthesis C-methylase UbiE